MQYLADGFLEIVDSDRIGVSVSGKFVSNVMHKRKPIQGCVSESKHGHLLYGDGWSMVVSDHHLEPKMSIVVTKLGGNLVSLMPF